MHHRSTAQLTQQPRHLSYGLCLAFGPSLAGDIHLPWGESPPYYICPCPAVWGTHYLCWPRAEKSCTSPRLFMVQPGLGLTSGCYSSFRAVLQKSSPPGSAPSDGWHYLGAVPSSRSAICFPAPTGTIRRYCAMMMAFAIAPGGQVSWLSNCWPQQNSLRAWLSGVRAPE